MNRRVIRYALIVLTVLTGTAALIVSGISLFSAVVVKPFANDFTTRTYTDSEQQKTANSVIESFTKNSDGFLLKYRLLTNMIDPFAGVLFENRTWDLHGFDRVTIELNPEESEPFQLIFADFVPGFSDKNNDLTWRIYEHEIIPQKGKTHYTVSLKDFTTPDWWFSQFGRDLERSPAKQLCQVRQIQFQNHPLAEPNRTHSIAVKKLTFSHAPLQSAPLWIATVVFGLLILSVRKRKSIPMPYRELDGDESHLSPDESAVVTFIGNHYARPDMTLALVSMETGLQQKTVRKVLAVRFDKSFKQYLMDIRLMEARRLLSETDRLIADISLFVGYKHATTFTRLFREQFGLSPREFRDKKHK